MQRIRMAFAAVLALLAPAAYAVDCDVRISDGAGLLRGDGTAAAAQRLADAGADVRVITVSSLEGQGNLDNLFRRYLSQCASWRAGSGIKNNLVVLMVSVGERRSIGLYFDRGGPFAALDSRWLGIQNGMKPALKAGDFDGGISRGLDDIVRTVAAAAAPPAAYQPPIAATPAPERPPVIVQTQPTDFSGLWRVLSWMVGIGFGFWFAGVLGRAISGARERSERRKSAQLRARNAKAACAAGIVDFPAGTEDLSNRLAMLQGMLLPEDVGDLPARVEEAKRQVRAATLEYTEVDLGVYDPERPNLSESEYARIGDFFEGIKTKLGGAQQAVEAIKDAVAQREKLPRDAESAEQAALAACRTAEEDVAAAKSKGYVTTTPERLSAAAMASLKVAQSQSANRHYGAAVANAAEARKAAEQASAWCAGLPDRIAKLASAIAAGTERTRKVAASIREGAEAFKVLAAEFNRSSYESIHGNGTEAARELNAAVAALAEAGTLATMEKQEWDGADAALAKANAAMDRADSLIHSIHSRKKHLEKVRSEASAEVEAATADINAARGYVKAHAADIGAGHAAGLDRAEKRLNEARGKLKAKWPDWPQIAKLAKEANEAADAVLEKARSEHDAAERQRQQAATNLREAKRARAKLREYIRDHRSDISSRNRSRLDDIDRRLAEAESSSDLALIIAMTQGIAADANSAYSSARSEVAAATPVYTPSYDSGPSIGGGSSSFSSSFDFGGGGDIGGGSSDF